MTELDQVWARMLADAAVRAGATGRGDIADYLRLKVANDAIRTAGVDWLLDTFIEIAIDLQTRYPRLHIERLDPHNFARGSSNMAGSRVSVQNGVKCLAIEAGWTRTPSDGIMKGSAYAFAQITHFGMPRAGAGLSLVRGETVPRWIADDGIVVDSGVLRSHFDIFLR